MKRESWARFGAVERSSKVKRRLKLHLKSARRNYQFPFLNPNYLLGFRERGLQTLYARWLRKIEKGVTPNPLDGSEIKGPEPRFDSLKRKEKKRKGKKIGLRIQICHLYPFQVWPSVIILVSIWFCFRLWCLSTLENDDLKFSSYSNEISSEAKEESKYHGATYFNLGHPLIKPSVVFFYVSRRLF